MVEDIEQICCHYVEALAQEKKWVSDEKGDTRVSTYETKGCYECGGTDTRCDSYHVLSELK